MTISDKLEHIVNNKLQVVMGMIDMALIEPDRTKVTSYLGSAKKACHDITRLLSLNRAHPDRIEEGHK